MISPAAFALVHLGIIVVLLAALGIAERRGRDAYVSRRGTPYRKLSTEAMLKRLRKKRR